MTDDRDKRIGKDVNTVHQVIETNGADEMKIKRLLTNLLCCFLVLC